MAYLERKIDKFLADWKSRPDRKPLIVKGARQIGKTESIKRFAESAYGSVVYINFLEKPIFGKIVSDGYSPEDIIRNITQIDGSLRFVPHETVIVFDEIQEYPDIATCFKFFCIDGRYDVIASGSLLGIHYRKIHSVSVGYQETFEMTSLDFEEFLRVDGKGAEFVDLLKSHMVEGRALPEVTMDVAGRVFMDYATVGGMPAVVERFAGTHNFSGITSMQREIVAAYRGDCGKYCEGLDAMKIRAVFDSVPGQLAKDYKKFQYSKVSKNARAREYEGCVEWLVEAGILNKCRNMAFPELPVRGNTRSDAFKLYMADTGLLLSMLDDEAALDFKLNRNFNTYKGAVAENAVAEALRKAGKDLVYFKRDDSTLEEDFFLRTVDSLVPVEVKARSGTSKSLKTLISSDHYPDIRFGVKLHAGNIGFSDGIWTFPLFCAFLLPDVLPQLPRQ